MTHPRRPVPPPGARPLPPPSARPLPRGGPPQYPPGGFAPPGAGRFPARHGMPMWQGQPRKSRTGLVVGGVLGGVVLLTAGVIGIAAAGDSSTSAGSIPSASYAPPSGIASPTPRATTERSTSRDTATLRRPDRDAPTRADSPRTREAPREQRPVLALADHPLFAGADYGLPNVPCSLSGWGTDRASVTRFFESGVGCLNTAWQQLLTSLNLPFSPPSLAVPARSAGARTPCSAARGSFAAFYCPTNHTIYMPMDKIQVDRFPDQPGVHLALLAHEYGHHVEWISGIGEAYAQARYEAGADSAEGLELSRRFELQAQCFSGMFLSAAAAAGGSVDRNVYREGWDTQGNRGDDSNSPRYRDHGSDQHYEAWWKQGAQRNRTQQCNTWAAADGEVS